MKKQQRTRSGERRETLHHLPILQKTYNVYDKKYSDVVFVDDLLRGVFNVTVILDEHNIDKMNVQR